MKKENKKKIYVIILFYLAVSILFCIITPVGDDMMFHLLRVGELGRELKRGGSFPVYMYRDMYEYYGYPIPIFYCGLFLFPFALLVYLGTSALFAYKAMVIVILLATFFSAYFCLKRWKNDTEFAVAGAFVYGIQPYFLIDLFVRAAIGESLAFVFIPLVLLGFWLAINGNDSHEAIICLSVGMTGIVCSHVISTILMIIALIVLLAAECVNRKISVRVLTRMLVSGVVCVLLSLWYVAPLLEQMMTMEFRAEKTGGLAKGTVDLISLVVPMHMNVVISSVLHVDLRPSQIGGAVLIVLAFVLFTVFSGGFHELSVKVKKLLGVYCLLVVCLMIPQVWIPLGKVLGFIQFPWRIFIIISLIGTAAIILSMDIIRDAAFYKWVSRIAVVSAIYVLITFMTYFMLRGVLYNVTGGSIGSGDTDIVYTTETSDDLYLSKNVNADLFTEKRSVSFHENDKIDYEYEISTEKGTTILSITRNQSDLDTWVEFPFLMYKGYIAYNEIDQTRYQIRMSAQGLVEVLIPANTVGNIVVYYDGTYIQKLSYIISVVSVVILIITIMLKRGITCRTKKACI